jgi:hypothetical protein
MKSYIYVFSNDALPGLYKVGFSTKDPEIRRQELSNTSIPEPYQIMYWCLTDDAFEVEQKVHKLLKNYKSNKEFFSCDFSIIQEQILAVVSELGKEIYLEELNYQSEFLVKKPELTSKEWLEQNKGRLDSSQYFALLRHTGHYK